MGNARVAAGGEGVEPADPVGEPVFGKKVERPVGDRRLVAEAFGGQPVQHLVGAERAVVFKQKFQDTAADRGEPCPGFGAEMLGPLDRFCGAGGVVVRGEGGGGVAGAGCGRLRTCHVNSVSGLECRCK